MSKETKLLIVRIIFIIFILIDIMYIFGIGFKIPRLDIYDKIIELDKKGLFWPYLLILFVSFLYSIISTASINNRRVQGRYISKILLISSLISSIIFIIIFYLMTNLYYTSIIGLIFLFALVAMTFISVKSEEYYLYRKNNK